MLSRWRINDAPTAKDPDRRLLQVKGALKDVHSLVRRFGAMCGRPKKEHGDSQFNYQLYLHSATAERITELESELKSMGGEKIEDAAPANGRTEPAPAEADKVLESPPAGELAPEPAPAVEVPPAPAVEVPPPPAVEIPPAPVVEAPPGSVDPFAPPTQTPTPPPPAAEQPGVIAPPARVHPAQAPLCGVLIGLNMGQSLEELAVGAFNRFTHAAVMSVMASPGAMYNPLYISGPPGSGKSHMLNALAIKLQEQSPDEPVLMTSGARLARAVEAAQQGARIAELTDFAQQAKTLIIDDVHLMGVTEQNRQALADIVSLFSSAEKQIVLASVYSQKLLGGLDEALQFKFHAGHAVEIKKVGESSRTQIVGKVLKRCGFNEESTGHALFVTPAVKDFDNLRRHAGRLLKLIALRKVGGLDTTLMEASSVLFGVGEGAGVPPAEELKAALTRVRPPPPGNFPVRVFFPAGHEVHADWAWQQMFEAARRGKWPFPFALAGKSAYALDPPSAAPFSVAGECLSELPYGAIVLGPPPGSGLAEHESDFYYAVSHLLCDGPVELGWLSFQRLKDSAAHTQLYLDMMPAPGAAA
ncbi:MAG: DnaA/Hda family protein [Elusimicrobiota bacterium]